ncbi:MAG: hypothetical protein WA639_12375 [Candidatus Acidiferrum sp.]
MENLSILNPPAIDLLNDPRVTSDSLIRMISEQEAAITKQVKDWASLLKPGDVTVIQSMTFACLQHQMHNSALQAQLSARQMDHAYALRQLNHRLERLTQWLIGLTVVLGVLTIPLALEAVYHLLKN